MQTFITADVTNGLENTFTDNSLHSQTQDILGLKKKKKEEEEKKPTANAAIPLKEGSGVYGG